MITQKARYAFKALIALARAGEAGLAARDVAAREQIPQAFLEQILLDLKRAGLVGSRRGREGGYFLARPATDITIGNVLRLVDGPVAPLPCLSRNSYRPCADCSDEATCAVRHVFAEAYDATVAVLDRTTLADSLVTAGTGDMAALGA